LCYHFTVILSILCIIDMLNSDLDVSPSLLRTLYCLSGAGFGNIEVEGDAEIAYICFLCVSAFGVSGYLLSTILSMSSVADVDGSVAEALAATEAVLVEYDVPEAFKNEVLRFQHYLLRKDLRSFRDVTDSVPEHMLTSVLLNIKLQMVTTVRVFAEGPEGAKLAMANALLPGIYMPEEYLVYTGEPAEAIFFLTCGFVDVFDAGLEYVDTLRFGSCFGERNVFLQCESQEDFKALTYCEAYLLFSDVFQTLCSDYPLLGERLGALYAAESPNAIPQRGGLKQSLLVESQGQGPSRENSQSEANSSDQSRHGELEMRRMSLNVAKDRNCSSPTRRRQSDAAPALGPPLSAEEEATTELDDVFEEFFFDLQEWMQMARLSASDPQKLPELLAELGAMQQRFDELDTLTTTLSISGGAAGCSEDEQNDDVMRRPSAARALKAIHRFQTSTSSRPVLGAAEKSWQKSVSGERSVPTFESFDLGEDERRRSAFQIGGRLGVLQ
jgi:CRP-like cAMP-binding protein